MIEMNVHEAKTQLSKLLDAAESGEDVIIARAGKPVARLVAIVPPKRVPGIAKGLWQLDDSFFDPLPEEELRLWEEGYEGDPLRESPK
jgi:prevent-host-death family protein